MTTTRRWVGRYREFGEAGMYDRSSQPYRSPRPTPTGRQGRIIKVRVTRRWGAARTGFLLGIAPSTVGKVLRRYRMVRLVDLDRATGRVIRRYEHGHAGGMVHVDIKKLGNIPDGGGHKRCPAPAPPIPLSPSPVRPHRPPPVRPPAHRSGTRTSAREPGEPQRGLGVLDVTAEDHADERAVRGGGGRPSSASVGCDLSHEVEHAAGGVRRLPREVTSPRGRGGMPEISDSAQVRRAHRSELDPVTFLWRSEFVYPDKVAVVHADRRYTYRQFAERVRCLASALQGAGLEKGDRVAFIAPNIPALLEAHYGVPAAGGVLVAVNYRLTADDVEFILWHSGARLVFVDHEYAHLIDDHADEGERRIVRIDDTGASPDPYEDFLAGGSADALLAAVEDEDEPISVNYTSGTTGQPKGAVYHHRGAYLNALGEVVETRLSPESVYLWTLPMFHCNGWCFTWAVCAVGGRHVCLRKVDAGRIWDLIDDEGVTHYNGAPTVQNSLLDHEKAHPLDREVTTTVSGSPPNAELFARLAETGIRPIHVYGSTELYGPYMICERQPGWEELPLDEQAQLLGRQGVHYVIAEPVRVVDDEGGEVAADGETLGEVLMRGNNVMTGYLDDPEQTEEALGDGWYHSGDLAVRHPDGYIELRDRKKDIIVSGGENISTIAVEQALAEHPAVAEVAVVSTPDDRWGERPKAFVELAPDAEADEEDILAFAKEHLAGFMRPVAVEITELPKTSTGKIQKKELRDREWQGRDRRVG